MTRSQSELAAACRSYLFVPGNRPERFDKACAAGAGAVIIDLEDAVAPNEKMTARAAVRDWLSAEKSDAQVASRALDQLAEKTVLIRINSATTDWFAGDLALCNLPGVAGIVLPKAEYAAQLRIVADAGASAILPLIESAQGFGQLTEIAQQARVQRLIFGSIDFQLDLGIDGEDEELLFFRSQLVLQSKLAGLLSPVDGVSVGINDSTQLCGDAQRARRLGFGAKLCIHPKQIEHVNRAFRPDAASVAWAARVIDAADAAGGAAVAVDGKMVDLPVLLKARAIRLEAELLAESR